MGIGVISISTAAKKEQVPAPGPPGPPFEADSADNGLSVDSVSGKIVLGNDQGDPAAPAQLLSFREIITQDSIGGVFGIILNAIQSLITTQLLGDGITIEGGEFTNPFLAVTGGDGAASMITAETGDFSITSINATSGEEGQVFITAQAGSGLGDNAAAITATTGDSGRSTVESRTDTTNGSAILSVAAGTEKLTIGAGTFNAGRISFKIGGLFETIAINTTTLCTRIMNDEPAPFNGATCQISGTHTYRKFDQSQGAGTFNVDRDTDGSKVFRNSGALILALPNLVGANFRRGFFIDALCNNAAGITIQAPAGATMRYGGLTSSVGGAFTSSEVGAYIRVQVIDSLTFNVCFAIGLWSIT